MSTNRHDYRRFWSAKVHDRHDGSSSHAHHHHHHRYATHDRIPLFGSMRPGRVLVWALAASVLSTVLFVFASVRGGIGMAMGLSVQWLYAGGHLLGCFGNSVLLWAIVSVELRYEEKVTFASYFKRITYLAAYATALYHLAGAVAYAFVDVKPLYALALSLWWVRTLFGMNVVGEFFKYGDSIFRVTAIVLFIYYLAGSPYVLPGYLSFAQWMIAKLAALGLAVMLYLAGRSKYR
ncbi:MAG: hypothetical protein IJV38_03420 [Prevotella sp.]|nr:hypothetical protein [Prevotella sp.]